VFLADRTIGIAYATVLCPSVDCLSVTIEHLAVAVSLYGSLTHYDWLAG